MIRKRALYLALVASLSRRRDQAATTLQRQARRFTAERRGRYLMLLARISGERHEKAVFIQKEVRRHLAQTKFSGIIRLERRLPKVVWNERSCTQVLVIGQFNSWA